jgi:hypothetical protein
MRRFAVVVTVRSEEKGQRILDSHPRTPKEKLSFVIVEDIAKDGAFDEVSEKETSNCPLNSKATNYKI